MKELTIIRHAKSDWGYEGLKDIDRCLNERGYGDAYIMSEWLTKHHSKPERVVSSTATRALSTAMIFARQLNLGVDNIQLEPRIYEAPEERLLEVINGFDESISRILMFGHNPGFTSLSNLLIKEFFIDNLPTCGMLCIKFSTGKWKDIKPQSGDMVFYRFPKDFRNKD